MCATTSEYTAFLLAWYVGTCSGQKKKKNKPGRQAFVGKANFLLYCATEMKAVQTGVSITDDLLGELENSFAQTNAWRTRNIPTFGWGPLEGNKTTPC